MRNNWLLDVLILFQYGLFYSFATRSGCPEYSMLEPCSCIHRPGADILFCAGLKNLSVLDQVLERSSNWTFDTLFVCQSNLQNIPSNSLVQRKVKGILVASSNMTSLFDKEADAAGNSVETLHINDVRFENGISWNMIRSLRKLRQFNLQFGNVPVIGSEVAKSFAGGLKHLRMSNTRTKEIANGAFCEFGGTD
ncbi:hypothetical protein JTE90_002990 [Oedothorax gibbosus]|uniref:Uncharacterized protein n=1 Tax=Oedothorax gibbosus TaxID=931172 RepID=A0AAV6VIL3_9ARAC|nr:hypothetical protein JTE90_002990 [Oedothorax gibbosus]